MNDDSENKPSFKSQIPGIIIALGTAGFAFWLLIYEYWPVPQLNFIQANIFLGFYSEKITVFLIWLVLLMPFVLIKRMIKKRKEKSS